MFFILVHPLSFVQQTRFLYYVLYILSTIFIETDKVVYTVAVAKNIKVYTYLILQSA